MPLHCKLALQRLQRKRLQGDPNSQTQTLQTLDIEELNENHAKRCPCCCHASSKEFQFFSSARRAENLENGLQEYFDVRARGQSYSSEAQHCQYLLFGVAQILFLRFITQS